MSIAGSPSRQTSARASSRAASSASLSGEPRKASARSRPGPEKKISGGKSVRASNGNFGGLSVECRQPRIAQLRKGLPPAFADRFRGRDQVKVESEMREYVPHRSRGSETPAGCSLHSPPGRAAIPPRRPDAGRRTSQTCAIALDPPGDAIAMWANFSWPPGGDSFPDRRSRKQGTRRAADRHCSVAASGGRWWHRDPSVPGRCRPVAASPSSQAGRSRFRSGPGKTICSTARQLFRHLCRRPAPSRRTRSPRSPLKCRRQHRQLAQFRRACWESAACYDLASTGDEVARPSIIAETGPFGEDVLVGSCGKRLDGWPAPKKAFEPRLHGRDRRLLEHHFAQPDNIRLRRRRARRRPPREAAGSYPHNVGSVGLRHWRSPFCYGMLGPHVEE